LDRSVFDFIHQARDGKPELPDFQAVRGAFQQGNKLSENSGFQENSHIQIALRDNTCVLGWFLPSGLKMLSADQLDDARARLAKLKTEGKPRVRAPNPSK
jgi:hypothetical protein